MTQANELRNPLKEVLNHGQSFWYDGLVSKEEFHRMIKEDGIRGATTNPTIFEKALTSGDYDRDIFELSGSKNAEGIYKTLAVRAVQEVADVFRPVYDEVAGEDGYVSMEVSPLLASDTAGTIREAKELHSFVNRKNLMIKVPATRQGIPAIETLISEGISVNVTLIFSVKRYQEVMEAYLAGLEKRSDAGKPVADIASVASFFVSRVDAAVDKLIEEKLHSSNSPGRSQALKNLLGKAAIANSKAAYKEFDNTFNSFRFRRLKSKGARLQRPLWASTGTKNPVYSDVLYVEALMGPNTVDTVPPATLAAFRHHGNAATRLTKGIEEASAVLKELQLAGIDLARITQELEDAGVRSFSDSYKKILNSIEVKINSPQPPL